MKKFNAVIIVILLFTFIGCRDQTEKFEAASIPKVDLHSAVVQGNLEAIRQHIKAGSDLNVLEQSRFSTPIITAAAMGNAEAAKLLINAGADLNYQNADGSTALHTAAVFRKNEVAKMLIDAGINLDTQNNDGATPLHTAAFFGNIELVKYLLEKGADKTLKNKSGKTAYETVAGPFEDLKHIYDAIGAGLRPLGVVMNYEQIKAARPKIAEMLK